MVWNQDLIWNTLDHDWFWLKIKRGTHLKKKVRSALSLGRRRTSEAGSTLMLYRSSMARLGEALKDIVVFPRLTTWG